jgi:hypothetical protein
MTTPDDLANKTRPSTPTGKKRAGRLVLKPSDIDSNDVEMLKQELADLRAAHNDLVWKINAQGRWLNAFAQVFRKTLKYAPWRYCAWVLPLPLPPFEEHGELPYLHQKDATPMKRGAQ